MEKYLDKEGELSVIMVKGFISLYESCNLKKGDVIQLSTIQSNPLSLYFNGIFLGKGEVVILGKFVSKFDSNIERLGIRLYDLNDHDTTNTFPGAMDKLLDIVPVYLELDKIQISLNDLKGLGVPSFIGLEKEYNKEEDVELLAAGQPIAYGKLIVVNDNFGIRITKVYYKNNPDIPFRSSGSIIDVNSGDYAIRDWNFKRPDKFSRNQILSIKNIHNVFVNNLKLLIPDIKKYKVERIDQIVFCEIYDEIKTNHAYITFRNETRPMAVSSMDVVKLKSKKDIPKYYIQQKRSKFKPPCYLIEHLKKISNKEIKVRWESLILLAIYKKSHLAKLNTENKINKSILESLQNAWKTIGNINFRLKSMLESFEKAKIVPDNDMCISIKIIDESNPGANMIIIYPYITLSPYLDLLE